MQSRIDETELEEVVLKINPNMIDNHDKYVPPRQLTEHVLEMIGSNNSAKPIISADNTVASLDFISSIFKKLVRLW